MLYRAKLGTFCLAPVFNCMYIWCSCGYDSGVHMLGAVIAITCSIPYLEDERMLDLAGTIIAIYNSINCKADVINHIEYNLVLISLYYSISVKCFVNTIYATLVIN